MPNIASARAAAVSQLGRCPSSASAMTGARIDDTATMNAERDGVVITRPAVWEMKPTATSVPNSRPPASSERSGGGRKRVAGAWAHLDHPVGSFDDVEVMLDDQHGVAGVHQAIEHAAQRADVVQMQAGRGLVQDVELVAPAACFAARQRQLPRDLEALCLAARERGGRLAEPQVAKTHLLEVPQRARQAGLAVKPGQR